MKKILAPYGIKTKNLNQHLINIGFTPKKINVEKNDLLFLYYSKNNIKENELLEEYLDVVYSYCDYGNADEYDHDKYIKEDLQNKINYGKNCLIDPFDDGLVNYDDLGVKEDDIDNTNKEDNDDYNDYYDYVENYTYNKHK
jgi:hypothetical protein